MEHFIVSARKYRPQNFEEVVGQQAITNTLENAIKNNHLAQALLFTGPRGVGKTSCARILAKKINQQDATNSGDEDFTFNIFELDAASHNSVDDIRSLTDQVRIPPQIGNYSVFIIDEVHMLSASAFNAFLKTLEEPPAHAIFILATTEKHKIIPTILSRCQIFDFKRIGVLDAKNYLKIICEKEGITAEDDALHIIAQKADGAMRDALSIFDRVVSFCGTNLTREAVTQNLNVLDYDVYFNMTNLLLENKIPEVLVAFNSVLTKGFEGHHFINGLASHFRDVMVCKDKQTINLLEVGDATKKKYFDQAEKASLQFLIPAIEKANDCDLKYKTSKNQRLLVELTLMQIASITFDGEKKKSTSYIIPATFFTSISPKLTSISTPIATITASTETTKKTTISTEKPTLRNASKRQSSLSLKSIHQKKEVKKEVVKENIENLPKDTFLEQEMLKLWKEYHQKMIAAGNFNMATALGVNEPKLLVVPNIELILPNKLIEGHFNEGRLKFLSFLKSSLNNFSIQIDIKIDETIEEKKAYGNAGKYKLLVKKNPALKKLFKVFELEV